MSTIEQLSNWMAHHKVVTKSGDELSRVGKKIVEEGLHVGEAMKRLLERIAILGEKKQYTLGPINVPLSLYRLQHKQTSRASQHRNAPTYFSPEL